MYVGMINTVGRRYLGRTFYNYLTVDTSKQTVEAAIHHHPVRTSKL